MGRAHGARAQSSATRSRQLDLPVPRLSILTRPTAPGLPDLGTLSVRRATPDDAAGFARDIGTCDANGFRARLSKANRCYLALEGKRILHSSWCARGATWTQELRTYLAPPPDAAYIYESLTVPEARGRGIYPMVLQTISADLHDEGVGQMWIGVEEANEASVRAIRKAGFDHAYSIAFDASGDEVAWEVDRAVDPATSLHIVTDRHTE